MNAKVRELAHTTEGNYLVFIWDPFTNGWLSSYTYIANKKYKQIVNKYIVSPVISCLIASIILSYFR